MTRSLYLIPYFFWIVITLLLIENSLIDDKPHLFSYIIMSLIIAFILEVLRNRWVDINFQLRRNRLILYLLLNLIIGIPFFFFIVLVSIPLDATAILIQDHLEYANWQQYLAIGYCLIWFVTNAVIVKPRNIKGIVMFIGSLTIMAISSTIFGLIIGLFNAEIKVI